MLRFKPLPSMVVLPNAGVGDLLLPWCLCAGDSTEDDCPGRQERRGWAVRTTLTRFPPTPRSQQTLRVLPAAL